MPILFPNPECPDLRNSMEFHQNPLEFHWNPPNSMEFHRNAPEFTGIHRILYFLSFADVATMAGGAVTYSSKKQSSVTLSSTESEYMALLHALKELIWLHRFLNKIGYDISDQNFIYCDNQGAIALTHNPEHHARTKHIDIQYHFVRNCIEDGTAQLEYCQTEDMVADGLTKALGPERHRRLAKMMGMGIWQKVEDYSLEITGTRSGSDER